MSEKEIQSGKPQKKKRFNLYNLFNPSRDGKGVDKEPPTPPTLPNFFKYFYRNMSPILSVSITLVLGNFPIFFLFFAMSGMTGQSVRAVGSSLYPLALALSGSGDVSALPFIGTYGVDSAAIVNGPLTYTMYGLAALAVLTFGPVMSGVSYILRNILRREPVFFIHDFFGTIKKNLVKSILFGIIDIGIIGISIYNIFFFSQVFSLLFFANLAILILFMAMRMYFYLQIVSFKFGVFKILKNSFILASLGFKRNFMAFLGIAALIALLFGILMIYLPLGIILPFILCGIFVFISVYAAWPVIEKFVIAEDSEDSTKIYLPE